MSVSATEVKPARLEHKPELDGIRGIALFGVLAFHCFFKLFLTGGAWIGVDIFFVLSGYLITTILLNENTRKGRIDMRMFWVRRLLRLTPAVIFTFVICAPFYKITGHGGVWEYLRACLFAGGYVENFVWGFTQNQYGDLGHTWSLAVEMQFYLIWPPVLIWMIRRKVNLAKWTSIAIGISYLLMVVESHARANGTGKGEAAGFPFAYTMPWTRFWEILVGALVAIILAKRTSEQLATAAAKPPQRWKGWLIFGGIGVVYLVAAAWPIYVYNYVMAWQTPLAAGLSALLIIHLDHVRSTGVGRLLAWRPLAWAGQISYGVYLVHYPVLFIIRDKFDLDYADAKQALFLLIPISFALASISYYFFEKPVLKLKSRFEAPRPEATATA